MGISNRFIAHQAPTIASMGRTALSTLLRRGRGGGAAGAAALTLPSEEVHTTIAPRAKALVRAYVRHTGGDASVYRRNLPPHMFPQWGFALAASTLTQLDYPLQKVLNAGCRMECYAPLPNDQPLKVRVRLESIDDNGRRAIIRQRVITETAAAPNALVAYITALVPLAGKGASSGKDGTATPKKKKKKKNERVAVPEDARELSYLKLDADAGLSFAKLTGDFNPVHWVPAYARAFGFRNCILHGFATMARAYEALVRGLLCGRVSAVEMLEVSFTKPLVLPAAVGVYVTGDNRIFVGHTQGGPAYLSGQYQLATAATTATPDKSEHPDE